MKSIKSRRKSRELALQVLFQKHFSPELDIQSSLYYFKKSFPIDAELWEYSKTLIFGLQQKTEELTDKIDSFSENWKTTRMSLIDLNLILICLYEVYENSIPKSVAINEALELAKKYSNADSIGFINGILDQILKDVPNS